MKIRSIKKKDVPAVYDFWKKNYRVSERDTIGRITKFIGVNKDLSTLAEKDGDIVGTTLGSFDGRKGYLYKIVVKENFRGKGLGKKLVKTTIDKILNKGALDIRVNCDKNLLGFYEKCGFKSKDGLYQLQIKKY